MSRLHDDQDGTNTFESKEGQRRSSCSNEVPSRCPSSGLNVEAEDDALRCLAQILVKAFLEIKKNEKLQSASGQ